ncbi:TonB-dependent receptor [Sphingosinicella rhizophila]|uniref:TonB-dependent receptor n=1 Tax=Sphingosinicella rhizophila TaxID=3050082 RepID=A0ABU3QA00_9SPHN|nr:TonB-dependent receptor [Sphingosinicella sp. GR2756]MDT9600122.1 TonB-dependent receptor [Sphingosinicella sp. GR2756]
MIRTLAAALLTGTCVVATATPAVAQSRTFDIPAGSLKNALGAYVRQSGRQLIFKGGEMGGVRSNGAHGAMSAEAALSAVLAGSGFVAKTDASGAVAIVRAASSISESFQGRGGVAVVEDEVADEEIVVTAQKKVENIQDVPASISVIGGRRLERIGATQLSDYAAYVPGLVVDGGGTPGQTRITLRGLSPITYTSMIGTYIDDTPLGSSAGWVQAPLFSLDLMPYDIERVEVLRGPQGTLYGANTMGGLLKYVTKSPDLNRFSGRAGAEVSTIGGTDEIGWGVRDGANVPIIPGKLAVSISVFNQYTPGYIDNGITGEKDENEVEQTGARLALLWQVTDALKIRLSAMGQNIDADGNAVVSLDPVTGEPLFGDLTGAHALDQPFRSKLRHYAATIDWDLGFADFTSATSYSNTKVHKEIDYTLLLGAYYPIISEILPEFSNGVIIPAGMGLYEVNTEVKKFTQEFRLASPGGKRLEWLIGAFYTDEDAIMFQNITAMDTLGVPVAAPFNPFGLARVPTKYREMAVFGNLTYNFSEAFDISFGGRFAKNKQDFTLISSGPLFVFSGVDGTTIANSKEDVFTYSVAPRWHISEDTMVYARVASGYRPGGPNTPILGIPPQVDSDRIVNYEIGLKSQFLDRRAMVDLALFRIDWKDIQTDAVLGVINYQTNGGRARSQGVEFNASFAPSRNVRLGMNTAYTDAKLIDPIPSIGAAAGDQLSYTPRWSGAVTADTDFPISGEWTGQAGGGLRYVGKRRVGFPGGGSLVELDAYAALDLYAGVSNDIWGVRLFVRNATDNRVYLTPATFPGQIEAAVLQPRTIGLALEAKF